MEGQSPGPRGKGTGILLGARTAETLIHDLILLLHMPLFQVRLLEPLIDWELEARTDGQAIQAELRSTKAHLSLAENERNDLLRENDKIIAHYRQGISAS